MTIFDDIDRPADDDGARHAEPDFSYLNRSGRSVMAGVRKLYECWFSRYPGEAQRELRARLRTKDDTLHRAAFFELALHELFRRLEYEVEVHPSVPESNAHPDFLLRDSAGTPIAYLEAVRVGGMSDAESKARARIDAVYDVLDRTVSPNYFISVEAEGEPATSLPGRAIRKFVEAKLRALNPDVMDTQWEKGVEFVEGWVYVHDGCTLTFLPIPKKPEFRGDPGVRPLGIMSRGAFTITPADDIRAAVVRKATKYGHLELPFIIAVNMAGIGADRDAATRALFGTFEWVVNQDRTRVTPRRLPNGAWFNQQGPVRTRLSGVLFFDYSRPSQIGSADIFWVPNPWALVPLEPPARLTVLEFAGDNGRFVERETASRLFDIVDGFPEN